MLYDGKDYYFSNKYKMQIVDRVGGVDSFGAGLIIASLEGFDAKSIIEFSVATDYYHVFISPIPTIYLH